MPTEVIESNRIETFQQIYHFHFGLFLYFILVEGVEPKGVDAGPDGMKEMTEDWLDSLLNDD